MSNSNLSDACRRYLAAAEELRKAEADLRQLLSPAAPIQTPITYRASATLSWHSHGENRFAIVGGGGTVELLHNGQWEWKAAAKSGTCKTAFEAKKAAEACL